MYRLETIIDQIVNLIGLPVFIIFIVLVLLLIKNRIIILLVLTSLIWRTAFTISSSRYCALFIVYSVLAVSLLFSKKDKNVSQKIFRYSVLLIVLSYNTIKAINNENRKSILYCRETLETLDEKEKKMFLITSKESYRVSGFNHLLSAKREINDEDDIKEIKRLLQLYKYWGDKEYLIIHSKNNDLEDDLFAKESVKKISSCLSGRKSTKRLNVYEVLRNNSIDDRLFSKERIVNGDLELMESLEMTQAKLRNWINNGLSFYRDNPALPAHEYLLPLWTIPPQTSYPMAKLVTDDQINGNHFLYLKLHDSTIYLLNKVPPDSGILSFRIKSVSNEATIYLMRYEYLKGNLHIPDDAAYALLIQNNQRNSFSIPYNACKNADSALFCINASDAEFYIDDISFVTKKDTEQVD